ncbi:unnamed protein product [Phyllotreta striolata]|uniref:Homeobox domain-containing protein n=1 Tax=Phyllotreta striolata TaxID=444603 RepID=A0A9N9XSQ5_PHYSR|nr:unnamed protein product [Phyllotreta striolata]
MVSYYPQTSGMYHPQHQLTGNGHGHFQPNAHVSPWYAGFRQSPHQLGAAPPGAYCAVEQDQQMWHHHPAHAGLFQQEFQEWSGHGPHHQLAQHQQHQLDMGDNQLPSPPITGSDMSSPGVQNGNVSPALGHNQSRPPPARSPYEWIKKTSYQSQPNPGKTRTKDKYRVVYTDHQRIELEKEFTFNNKYITIRRKSELASNLGLSERQIKIWFQNRRAKERKQNKKRAEEKGQIEMPPNGQYHQQTIINQHPQIHNMDMHNQQTVLPNIVPSTVVMQRFMETNHPMKLESSENDQLG